MPVLVYIVLVAGVVFITWLITPNFFANWKGVVFIIGAAAAGVGTVLGGLIPLIVEWTNKVSTKSSSSQLNQSSKEGSPVEDSLIKRIDIAVKTRVESYIKVGKLEKALDELAKIPEIQEDVVLLNQRLNNLKQQEIHGTLTYHEVSAQKASIAKAILNIISS